MATMALLQQAKAECWSDEEVVARVLGGETALFEIIMRRYNQRLYRVARSILRNDAEAEDVMQDAYVRAYQHLDQFAGRAKFATWLTRIAVHEALARVRRRSRMQELDAEPYGGNMDPLSAKTPDPEQQASDRELLVLLQSAVLALPANYRSVLVLRDIEEMSTADTAEALELSEENVKVRLHRARALLRRELFARAGAQRGNAFSFMGARCDRMVEAVMRRLAALQGEATTA
ncbi:MAG TPA: RNA polymerase sigma factor [Terriglobales bacterium]|nr:RNA polymerase sigma factor [Terriglobales bacterium]